MEKREEIKISLSTVVLLFVIFLLIVALAIVYYFGFINERQPINNLVDTHLKQEQTNNIENLSNNNISNTNIVQVNETVVELTPVFSVQNELSKSYEDRIQQLINIHEKKNTHNNYGYIYAEDLIENVRLEKFDDYFILKADINNPITFSKVEVENLLNILSNGEKESVKLGEYTMYRNADRLLTNIVYSNYKDLIKNMMNTSSYTTSQKNIPLIVLDDNKSPFLLIQTEKSEYYLVQLNVVGAAGFTVMGNIKKDAINIYLLNNEKIYIDELEEHGIIRKFDVTVEEYYNNYLKQKSEKDELGRPIYTYDINDMSISSGCYMDYIDALQVINDELHIFYKNGGV